MNTETAPQQPACSGNEIAPEQVSGRPTPRRMAYHSVLIAVVIGIALIGVLWMVVAGQKGDPAIAIGVTAPDVQLYEDTGVKEPQAARIGQGDPTVDQKLASLSDRIERGFEAQRTQRAAVRQEIAAVVEGIQAIKATIADLRAGHQALHQRLDAIGSQLAGLAKAAETQKVVKRQLTTSRKPRPVKTPPFQLDAIDVWDGATYAAVSQAGRVAFLKAGQQQSGWTLSRIDRIEGRVDFKGPAGQVRSVSLAR